MASRYMRELSTLSIIKEKHEYQNHNEIPLKSTRMVKIQKINNTTC